MKLNLIVFMIGATSSNVSMLRPRVHSQFGSVPPQTKLSLFVVVYIIDCAAITEIVEEHLEIRCKLACMFDTALRSHTLEVSVHE